MISYPPIDIHPNLPLTSFAYRIGLPELIISSEVLVIKGQSKSDRGASKEAIVSLVCASLGGCNRRSILTSELSVS